MNSIKNYLIVFSLLGLAACTTSPLSLVRQDKTAPLQFYQTVSSASAQERADLQKRIESALQQGCSMQLFVQLALLKSVSPASPLEDEEALNVLAEKDSCPAVGANADEYRVFASVWQQMLEQRRTLHENGRRIVILEEQSRALREQIEALTNIEEQLNRREDVQ